MMITNMKTERDSSQQMALPVLIAFLVVMGSSLAWDGLGLKGNLIYFFTQVRDGWLEDHPSDDAADDADDVMEALGIDDDDLFIQAVVDSTGLNRSHVVALTRLGQTLADVTAANGSSRDTVIENARSRFQAALVEAVAAGEVTGMQAQAALADFEAEAREELVEIEDEPLDDDLGIDEDALLMRATAEITHLAPGQVLSKLRMGRSLGQIAHKHGSDGDAIISVARSRLEAALDEALTGGEITAEQREKLLAKFDAEALIEVYEAND